MIDGMDSRVGASGLTIGRNISTFQGNPNGIFGYLGSELLIDIDANELYMNVLQGGSEWVHLVSGADI